MTGTAIAIVVGGDAESRKRALSAEGPDLLFVGGAVPSAIPDGAGERRLYAMLTGASDDHAARIDALPGKVLDGVFLRQDAHGDVPAASIAGLSQRGLSEATQDGANGSHRAFLGGRLRLRPLSPAIDQCLGEDDVTASFVIALRLGYGTIGLLDLDRQNDIEERGPAGQVAPARLEALASLRRHLFESSRGIQLHTLNELCPIAGSGLCSVRSASEFLGFRRLDVVVCPLTPRERDRALDNLERWSRPEAAPYLSAPSQPMVDLAFVYNCAEDPTLSRPLIEAFERSPSLKRMFRGITVKFLGLSGEDDVYVRTNSGPLPRYGYKAGPNLLFFGMLASLRHYRGFAFMMETDCVPIQPGWVQGLDALCRNRPHAWVIGSLYRGPGQLGNNIKRHLNGNAIYAVGDLHFRRFLDSGYLVWLKHHIETAEPDLAFDTAWERFALEASAEIPGNAAWQITQQTYSRFVPCEEIVNIAGEAEVSGRVAWSLEALRETFPYAVIAHGPVAAEARNLEATSLVAALSRLTETYLFASAGTGLTVDRWIQEGGARIDRQFRWSLGNGGGDGRCGVQIRRDTGFLRVGDRLVATLTLAADRPVDLRISLQATDLVFVRAVEETGLRVPGRPRTVVLKLKVPRDVDGAQLVIELAGRDTEPVILAIEEIELRLESRREGASLSLSQASAAALGYGALSAIGPSQARRAPRASLVSSTAPPGGSVLEAPPLAPEPTSYNALRPRYSLRTSQRGGPILARSSPGGIGEERPIARLTIANGRVETLNLLAADEKALRGRGDGRLSLAVPKGRMSLLSFLRDGPANSTQVIPADLRPVAEELICYWSDVEALARSHGPSAA